MKNPIHLQTGSSSVRCGARMAQRAGDGGWDLADTAVEFRLVTCEDCRRRVDASARSFAAQSDMCKAGER
jgi:hypothetical protein